MGCKNKQMFLIYVQTRQTAWKMGGTEVKRSRCVWEGYVWRRMGADRGTGWRVQGLRLPLAEGGLISSDKSAETTAT